MSSSNSDFGQDDSGLEEILDATGYSIDQTTSDSSVNPISSVNPTIAHLSSQPEVAYSV